jgi:hypothetical protein
LLVNCYPPTDLVEGFLFVDIIVIDWTFVTLEVESACSFQTCFIGKPYSAMADSVKR